MDYRALLSPEDWRLFNALRDWRRERSLVEGLPPYLVLTNDILAEIARRKPRSLNELGQIPGMGEGRVKRFGRDLLAALAPYAAADRKPPEAAPVEPAEQPAQP